MVLGEIRGFLSSDWARVQEIISESLKSDIDLLEKTNEAILSHSGKQLRPMISLLAARACSSSQLGEAPRFCAAASELLHNATLLHDDVADGGTLRRGNPTTMSILGSRASVLLGDFWLVRAVDCILAADNTGVIIRVFAKTLSDLAEGEMLQLEKAAMCDTAESDYYRIVYCKTASLFKAAALSAALAVKAPEDITNAVAKYAEMVGMAFQIRDDILDYSPHMDDGKASGVDILEKKITLPLLGALANVDDARAKEIRAKVLKIGIHPEYRDEILDFVHENGGIEYAGRQLKEFTEKAVAELEILEDSQEKEYLKEVAKFIGDSSVALRAHSE